MSLNRNHCKHRPARRQLFPEKLWDLVNRPSSGIQWSPDGKRIEVERTQLEKFIGTKFRSHNFDSFIRQLHFYGFRKSGNSYHHDKFQRDQPAALLTMKRKYSNLSLASLCSVNSSSPYYTSQASNTSSNDSVSSNTAAPNVAANNTGGNNNTNAPALKVSVHGNDCAIDYSITKKTLNSSLTKSPGKSLSKLQPQQHAQPKLPALPNEKNVANEISLYTMKPIESLEMNSSHPTCAQNLISSFTNIREESAQADREDNTIKITIPEILKDTGKSAWPKTLVFENYWSGNQKILTAYFIYRTSESH